MSSCKCPVCGFDANWDQKAARDHIEQTGHMKDAPPITEKDVQVATAYYVLDVLVRSMGTPAPAASGILGMSADDVARDFAGN